MTCAFNLPMPPCHPTLSRPWAWPVAALVILTSGCTRADPNQQLADRTERAVADLERLRPRMAKAGTPGADELAGQLGAVREGLAALPTVAPVPDPPPPPPSPAAVRCPDDGCWRLGAALETGAWRLRLKGGGTSIDDSGPPALGVAVGIERASPVDHRVDWSWGVEAVGTRQQRTGGQSVTLVGLRPFVRGSLAVSDRLAITVRPILEAGRASVRLGEEPAEVIDQADIYGALGLRAGMRVRLSIGGELNAEIGWREAWFNTRAGPIDYRASVSSPEAAIGWSGRF